MGKKKSRQEDDYWTSGFEQDFNDLVLHESPTSSETVEVKQPDKRPNKTAATYKEPTSSKQDDAPDSTARSVANPEEKVPASVESTEPKSTGKPSKKAAHVEALRQMLARKQALEEEQRRLQREEEEREQQRLKEEARKKEEEESKRRELEEQERLKNEDLRRKGLLLTKAQQEKAERNRIKLEQMKSLGLLANIQTDSQPDAASQKPQKPIYTKKKKQTKQLTKESGAVGASKDTQQVPVSWEDEAGLDSEQESVKVQFQTTAPQQPIELATNEEDKKSTIASEIVPSQQEHSISDMPAEPMPTENLRSPILCILGHVDTGKTKILDKIRQTNVQEGEAGGITQQIGATYFPIEVIKEKTRRLLESHKLEYNVPGLLIIDTPGHESFTNLRTRGSSLCNIAILVIDITAGLEAQTLESLRLLKQKKTPFVVALNKVDRLYDWNPQPDQPIQISLRQQKSHVLTEYDDRVKKALLALAEQGLNAELYYKNRDFRKYVSVVPTSAITGEGIPDLLMLVVQLTQKLMAAHLRYQSEHFECTVLEVKVIEGLGTTIDCILSNGILTEGDRIAVCGLNGPIITTVRAILTPQPMKEMRVKGQYVHHRQVKAALGIKLCAPELEKTVAGSKILLLPEGCSPEQEESIKSEVMADLNSMLASVVQKTEAGVCVQASTLGSLEALLQFLSDMKIPVSGVNIGPVHKKDVVRASTMLERAPEYAMILAFDVRVEREAQELADDLGIKIFTANIIYHLFDQFTTYIRGIQEERKKTLASQAIFPCVLKIVPGCVFNTRDPIILGISVQEGSLRIGTPLCVISPGDESNPAGTVVTLGRVTSIEQNHKPVPVVRKGGPSVAIKIEHEPWDNPKMVGRHFGERDELISRITRQSIDVLKEHFRNDVDRDDWQLIVRLKKQLNIL